MRSVILRIHVMFVVLLYYIGMLVSLRFFKGFSGALSRNFYISPRVQTTAPSANFKKRKAEQNE